MEKGKRGLRFFVTNILVCLVLSSLSCSAMAQCSAIESQALLTFKAQFLDPRDDLSSWGPAGANCCSWKGIQCSSSGVGTIDLSLDTPIRGLTVTLDPNNPSAGIKSGEALAQIPQLVILRTNWVVWNAPFPVAQLLKLNLRELVVKNAGLGNKSTFGGSVPNELGQFSNLEILVLAGTRYNTGLPSGLCKLTKLKTLEISSSFIPSIGPSCLGSLGSLQEVRLNNNVKATGGLPVWPTTLPNLKVLDLSGNAHSGDIPVQYGKLGTVQLFLASNKLAGRIPEGLSGKPESTFRPGNPTLCGAPLPTCQA